MIKQKEINWKYEIGDRIVNDKRDITIVDKEYKDNMKWYKYQCNVCGWTEGWIREYDINRKHGCSVCCPTPRVLVQGINDIPTIAPWMVKYFQGGYEEAKLYTRNGGCNPNNKEGKIYPVCPDCGRIRRKKIKISRIFHECSIGCSCSDGKSYCEKFMFSILEQLRIDFETEYSPEWVGYKRYDFHFELNNEQYIIETHGEQHYNQQKRKGARTLENEQENDRFKKELALSNGIKEENYIVIDCRESILEFIKQNILESNLAMFFDLSKIDWNICNEKGLRNLVKIACEIKRNNPEMTTTEIGLKLNLKGQTIVKYLKQGLEIWDWCDYNPKEEQQKNGSRNGKLLGKRVEIFKDDISLGIFKSTNDLERQSEKLFGIKLNNRCISMVCLGKQKLHRGFSFKYI